MSNQIQSPTQRMGNELPGAMNARPAPQSAMESLNKELGKYFRMLGDELMKGRMADPTAVARAKAGIKAVNQAAMGSQQAQAGPPKYDGNAGARPRPAGREVDPITHRQMNGSPGTSPF